MSKDRGVNLKVFPLVKNGIMWTLKIYNATNSNATTWNIQMVHKKNKTSPLHRVAMKKYQSLKNNKCKELSN